MTRRWLINPIDVDVALVRVDHTDPERGWWADPPNVEVGGYTFDTEPLRRLIRLLIADLMTIAGKDMIDPDFTVDSGP